MHRAGLEQVSLTRWIVIDTFMFMFHGGGRRGVHEHQSFKTRRMRWCLEDLDSPDMVMDTLWCVTFVLAPNIRKHTEASVGACQKDSEILRQQPQGVSNHVLLSGSFKIPPSMTNSRRMGGLIRSAMTSSEIYYANVG